VGQAEGGRNHTIPTTVRRGVSAEAGSFPRMTTNELLNRDNWHVRAWPDTFPQPPEACAAVAAMTKLGDVHVMVNPGAENLCTLEHLPEDVERLIEDYVAKGPDGGWNPLAGGHGHATFLSAGDTTVLPKSQPSLAPAELEAALRRGD
jgi:hypothetical protein